MHIVIHISIYILYTYTSHYFLFLRVATPHLCPAVWQRQISIELSWEEVKPEIATLVSFSQWPAGSKKN